MRLLLPLLLPLDLLCTIIIFSTRHLKVLAHHQQKMARSFIRRLADSDGGTPPIGQHHQMLSQVQWVIEQGQQRLGHFHRVVLHYPQLLSLRVGMVVSHPVRIQLPPLYFKGIIACSIISMQVKVLEEGEQFAASLRQVLLLFFFFFFTVFFSGGGGGAVG
ncbi:hypothetical protein TYRP_006397 [Tyrophagus putrescentiae]|nr:hypothetical protein TYRP_006397 [Tyrophagus putrescentiae]